MANRKGNGIYKDDDFSVVVKINKEVHEYLTIEARKNFRSIPMHISYIMTTKMRESIKQQIEETSAKTEILSRDTNKPLYTEEELEDIYKKSKEVDDNVNRG